MSIDYFGLAWKIPFPRKPLKKLVLLALADHHNDEIGFSWPSYKTIATRTGISRRTVISLIAELEADGFVSRVERHKVGHLNTSNAYYLNETRMKTAAAQSETATNGEPPSPPPTKAAVNGEAAAPPGRKMVSDMHHDSDQPAPSMVINPHHNGDLRAPKLLSNLLSEPLGEPPPTAAPAAAEPPAPAAAAANPLAPILDWLAFDDALTPKERAGLDQATLLAWAYWGKLKAAESHGRITNPIGWVRSQWRNGRPPRADLLRLARGWLALDDDGRARLLGRIEWAADYGTTRGDAFEEEFPDIPPVAAAAIFAATGGQLAPPELSPATVEPVCPTDRTTPAAQRATTIHRSVPQTDDQSDSNLWRDALPELEMQMTRATYDQLLRGTTATLDADDLTVHVRNPAAVEWLQSRLHPVVQRAVHAAAGRPITVHYVAPQEAIP